MKKQITPKKNPPKDIIPDLIKNHKIHDYRVHLIILGILAFALYFNSIFGEYVLDDMIVITHNSFTQKGFAGIKDLIMHDSFLGFTGMENQLAGGRYRPLSIVSFAVEYGVYGLKPHLSHGINVVLHVILILLLYRFLDLFIFKRKHLMSFIAVLYFLTQPAHTEVVANIKSRDELFSMIFLLLSLEWYFNYLLKDKNIVWLILSLLSFLFSLLSKENALVYIAILPLMLYFFHNFSLGRSIIWGLPIALTIFIYFVIRVKLTGFKMVENGEVLNAPFLYASKAQAFGTKVALLGKYLLMLIYPYKLSYDYSYNQIRYIGLSDFRFILSFLINGGLIVLALVLFAKRHILSFCILFYYMNMALVTNFLFEVGTPFADRFLFQPSLAPAILIGFYAGRWLYRSNASNFERNKWIAAALVFVGATVYSVRTISRNVDWKSENVLFPADVKACPNSAKTNNNCGVALINLSALETEEKKKKDLLYAAVGKIERSVSIHPKYVDAYLNLGVAYSRLDDVENAEKAWVKARELSPAHPKLKESFDVLSEMFAVHGFRYNQQKDFQHAIEAYQKAIDYHGKNYAEYFYNLGGNYLMLGNVEKAKEIWKKTLELKPDHKEARRWLDIISKNK